MVEHAVDPITGWHSKRIVHKEKNWKKRLKKEALVIQAFVQTGKLVNIVQPRPVFNGWEMESIRREVGSIVLANPADFEMETND